MTPAELFTSMLRGLGVLSVTETLGTDLRDYCLEEFNMMLDNWSADGIMIYARIRDTQVLTPGTANYALTNVMEIYDVFVRGSSDYPVKTITEKEYNAIPNKATTGRPYQLFYKPDYTAGSYYLYFTPDTADTLYIDSYKQFIDVAHGATITLPDSYLEPLKYNMMLRVADGLGASLTQTQVRLAESSLTLIRQNNFAKSISPTKTPVWLLGGRRQKISGDQGC